LAIHFNVSLFTAIDIQVPSHMKPEATRPEAVQVKKDFDQNYFFFFFF
jgi:hypothetical protein